MKKLLALLLSIAMVASMFVGVAFASTPTAVLNVTVTGAIALGSTIQVGGSVLNINGMPVDIYHVVVQRQAPGETGWTLVQHLYGVNNTTLPGVTTIPTTSVLLATVGTYRVALTGNTQTAALNATGGTAAPALVHTIGTIAPTGLTVTPGVPSVTWSLYTTGVLSAVTFPLTVTPLHSITPILGLVKEHGTGHAVLTASFNGNPIPVPNIDIPTGAVNNLSITLRLPESIPSASGTIVLTVRADDRSTFGTANLQVVPRAAFNADITVSPSLALDTSSVFSVTVFDGAGRRPTEAGVTFSYARATLAGPFTPATTFGPIVILGSAAVPFTAVTPRHGGTITATVEFFDAAHNLLHTLTRDFTVAGWRVELPTATFVRGSEVTLRAIVTDAAGNRVNSARVTFQATGSMFSLRDAAGVFAAAGAATTSAVINGQAPVQPRGTAVVNGEYSIDAILRLATPAAPDQAIRVIVEQPIFNPEGTAITGWAPRANWARAITVTPTLGYTVTLAHTLLAGGAAATAEDVLVTVLDTAGAPVTAGLWFTAPGTTAPAQFPHIGGGVYRIPMWQTGGASTTLVVRAFNASTRETSTLEGSTTITAVAPVVAVTPAGGRLTASFYDVITVSVTDPRPTVPVAVERAITVRERQVATPRDTGTATTGLTATVPSIRSRAVTTPAADWAAYVAGALASTRQFEVLAHAPATLLSIRGVVQTPNVSVMVGGAAAVDLTFGAATLAVTPAELLLGRPNTISVTLNNAHSVAMVGGTITLDGLMATTDYTIPATGTLSLTITPVLPTTGVMPPSHIRITATPVIADRTIAPLIRTVIPVVAPPADTVAPVITTNAPTTTTAATVPVTITATDNVAVTQLIVDGVSVAIVPTASVSAVRTLTLAVGGNTFIVQAADAAGNAATHTITIERTAPPAPPADTVAPVITHNAPATTALESVPVTITATDAVTVTRVIVGGVEVPVIPAASVSVVRTLPLAVGANPFVVQAADAAGNIGTVTITITRTAPVVERVLPTIEVTAPSITTEATAMITIVARDNVAVTGMIFEGVSMSFFPAATVTVFRTVDLREGLNSFALSVTDAAGNAAHRVIVIDRRTPAPVVHTITLDRANPAIGLDVPATVRNGRLFVPFRWFAERILGATVEFRVVGAAEIVTLHRGNMHVELTLNSPIAKVNGVPVDLGRDMVPYATGGRTLVPARFLAETFGYVVNWNPVTNDVTFTLQPTRP